MFVASRVESGNEGVLALLPQVTGYIQTAIGCGTLRRANGIAVQVMAGDPVCQGDVIETAADGLIGIFFIDGTVFNLSGDSRVVIREFVCHSNSTSPSALFEVTRGTFAFIAGQVAKTNCLRVDTPLGTIRGPAHASGVGMLSLVALIFAAMKEVQAAEPNVTFLDDASITYKDLEHGAFELVTKEAVPRHIIVEDPGETIVLHPKGSSISVNQVANTATRMAELQAAQQEVMATLAKGLGPNGSGTPPLAHPLPVQPINFMQSDGLPAQNWLPPLPNFVIPEFTPFLTPPQPPTLSTPTGPTETDTVVFDTFTATSGTFTASSSTSGATLTFGISGGIAGNTVLGGLTYDVSRPGSYGTLYLNSTTGAYTFVPNSDAINALTAPTTENFVITVSDQTLSVNETFTIVINGVNDAAIISGTATGSVIEAGGVANATPGTPTVTGTLTDVDVDNPSNTFTAVGSPKASTGGYGTFTMTAAGVWTYTLENANNAVQALNAGDTLTDNFTVTTVDGTPQVVTITIHGANDAAIISGTSTGSVIEAGGVASATPGLPTATGTLTDTDVDNTANAFTAVSSPMASAAGYGSFTITAAGVWTYTLNDTNSTVQALNVGDTLTDSFTVTTVDGTAQVVTITINGANDAATISGTTSGAVIEAGGVANATPGTPTATGTLTDADADNPPGTFTAVSSPTASAGGYGSFTITAAGVWTYTLDNANGTVQALNVGETLADTFTVTTVDGTPQVVTITINGTNDAAVISGTTTGSVIEAGGISPGTPIATGTLTDIDVDNPPNTFTAMSSPTVSDDGYGSFTMTAAGVWTYTLDNSNSVVDALDVGETLTDTFTVHTVDGTAQVVTVTIHGASDADPNDFDNLATGTTVISDPPFVFGTPGHDSIEGGGNNGQIIYGGAGEDTLNGTGVNDIIYGGSGNDTIKGNGGDDTIYGGSGSDTINGNNGNDTIIGGFGADNLTGSNGDDRFVYLSAVDSHAGQFDTITDFISGSDRIDLTALGALAFLALTPTSTSVPAHTIAWLYDSASNETIVYVNPTDQTLSIGNSNLLEIHLQGIATIQASDFVDEPTTAPVVVAAGESVDLALAATAGSEGLGVTTSTADASSLSTVSDGALVADGSWTLQTTDNYFSFEVARDRFDSIDHARFTSFDEAWTHSTEYTDGDAVTAPASGSSIELHRGQATGLIEDNFKFNQALVQNSAGATTIGDGAVLSTAPDALRFVEHGATSHGGDQIVRSHGDSETSSIVTLDKKDHSESILTNAGSVDATGTHVNRAVTAGSHGLEDSFHFKDKISGSEHSDVVDLADVGHTPASIGHGENIAGPHGPPSLPGQHSADHSNIVPDHAGSAVVTHVPHDLMV